MPPKKRLIGKDIGEDYFRRLTAHQLQQKAFDYQNIAQKSRKNFEDREMYLSVGAHCALDAASLYEKEGRFGPAEKMYKLAKDLHETRIMENEKYKPEYPNKMGLNKSGRDIRQAEYRSKLVHDKRLISIGKYLGKREGRNQSGGGKLENTLGIISILGMVLGLLFLSGNLTGNVIGNSTPKNILGLSLILIGLIGAFLYFKISY